jgi:hypothetical protein
MATTDGGDWLSLNRGLPGCERARLKTVLQQSSTTLCSDAQNWKSESYT